MARSAIVLSLPATLLVLACGGGSAGTGTEPPVLERAAKGPDAPAGGREPSGAGREAPPSSQNPPPPSSDPPPGGPTPVVQCFHCDADYSCSGSLRGLPTQVQLSSKTKNGVCLVQNADKDVVVIACDGKILKDGVAAGTWAPTKGGYAITFEGDTLSCIPAPQPTPGTR